MGILDCAQQPGPTAATLASAALRSNGWAAVEGRRGGSPGPIVSCMERVSPDALAEAARFLGLAKPPSRQSRCSRHKIRLRDAGPTSYTLTENISGRQGRMSA